MARFETNRLVVRDVVEGDLDIMFSIYTQEKNMRYISDGRYDWTIFELRDKYSRINKSYSYGYGIFIVELKDSGVVIGEAGLFSFDRENRIFELGYILEPVVHLHSCYKYK
ncbi:GNAT family N-acetyltransferase [uncultured Coprobacter sp.]|uniref:GNAT family N-acetyltransferase n=1 Tax=uncultured Coprobacter sp. TaxID=1720550 RepID=UPI00260BE4D8|nr:GNAT family N-acetyltransferase [uncultured Coprobacter sp.]